MDVKSICIGNYLLREDSWLIVERVSDKSINIEIEKQPDGCFLISGWISLTEVTPIAVTSAILEDLGFRYEYQRYTYRMPEEKVYIVRRGERFFFAIENERNILTELSGVHHLQNLMLMIFNVSISLKRNRWKYFKKKPL